MKTSSAKAKARRLQDAARDKILAKFPDLEPDDVKCAIMGETGKDLHLSPAAQRRFPFAVECKNQEKLNIWSALKQAQANAGGHTPLVIFKRNRSDIYCCLTLDDLLELLR